MSAEANPPAIATPRARRRRLTGTLMEGLATAAAVLAVVVLAIVLVSVAKRGLPAINLDFFTQNAAPFGQSGGGIANAIVGTVIVIGIATVMAVPAGVVLAIFNTEFAPRRVAEAIRLTLNVLAGVPTIVIGVFIFSLVVVGRGQSAFAGSTRAFDRDAAADRPRDRGSAAARAPDVAGGQPGARRVAGAHRHDCDPSDRDRRDRDRDHRRRRTSRR